MGSDFGDRLILSFVFVSIAFPALAEVTAVTSTRFQSGSSKKKSKHAEFYLSYEETVSSQAKEKAIVPFEEIASQMDLSAIHQTENTYFTALEAGSYDEQINYLKEARSHLSVDQRLYLLGMYGEALSRGYDLSRSENRNLESLFENLQREGSQGGACADIHTYLSEIADSLGFESAGIHSGTFQRGRQSERPTEHAMAHFRDPATGEYYVVNYSTIFATGKKSLIQAIEFSTRWMGPFADVSYVESKSGKIHKYLPRTSRWAQSLVRNEMSFDQQRVPIIAEVGNKTRYASINLSKEGKNFNFNAFWVSSEVMANEGTYRMGAFGGTGEVAATKKIRRGPIKEMGAKANIQTGVLHLNAPVASSVLDETEDTSHKSLFVNNHFKGYIRSTYITGQIEVQNTNLNFINYQGANVGTGLWRDLEIHGSLENQWGPLPVRTQFKRVYERVPGHIGINADYKMQTAYDSAALILEIVPESKRRMGLKAGTYYYALEGSDQNSATATKNSVEIISPVTHMGVFTLKYDLIQYLLSPSQDPFYDSPVGKRVSLDVQKQLRFPSTVGVGVTWTEGNQVYPFTSTEEAVSPELSFVEQFKGLIFIGQDF